MEEDRATDWWNIKIRCSKCNNVETAGKLLTHPSKDRVDPSTRKGHTCCFSDTRCMWDPNRTIDGDTCERRRGGRKKVNPHAAIALHQLPYCTSHTCKTAGCLNGKFSHCDNCEKHGGLPYTAARITDYPTAPAKSLLTKLEIKPVSADTGFISELASYPF